MKSVSDQGTLGNITPGVDIKFEWDKLTRMDIWSRMVVSLCYAIHIMYKNVSMYLNIVANHISE
jgi:hypothetical protein